MQNKMYFLKQKLNPTVLIDYTKQPKNIIKLDTVEWVTLQFFNE